MTHSNYKRDKEPVSADNRVRASYPCPEWEAKLVYMHPDDLRETERMELFKHISRCSACATFRRTYRAVNEIIRDLPGKEEVPALQLPPKLKHLWEFEDMQRMLSREESLLQEALLSEISGQAGNKMSPPEEHTVLQEMNQDEKNAAPTKLKRSRIAVYLLFMVACLLLRKTFSFIYRRGYFRKRGSTVERATDKGTRSAPEKEPRVVPAWMTNG